jgi:hypothetical protein
MDHERQAQWGRIGGLTAWSRNDAATMTAAAHGGFRAKFEREVVAAATEHGETLADREIELRAERARRAYMLTLAAKSAAVRRRKAATGSDTAAAAIAEAGNVRRSTAS